MPCKEYYRAHRETCIETQRKWRTKNKKAHVAIATKWNKENPTKRQEIMRRRMLKKFGMTLKDFDEMLTAQSGVCPICKRPPPKKGRVRSLAVDHDHASMKVRGLLCVRCNVFLGWFEQYADEVMEYLKWGPSRN